MIKGHELVPVNVEGWIDWHGAWGGTEYILVSVAFWENVPSQLLSQASEKLVFCTSGGSYQLVSGFRERPGLTHINSDSYTV